MIVKFANPKQDKVLKVSKAHNPRIIAKPPIKTEEAKKFLESTINGDIITFLSLLDDPSINIYEGLLLAKDNYNKDMAIILRERIDKEFEKYRQECNEKYEGIVLYEKQTACFFTNVCLLVKNI